MQRQSPSQRNVEREAPPGYWLNDQREELKTNFDWKQFLLKKMDSVTQVFKELADTEGGLIEKQDFRKALAQLGLEVDPREVNTLFDAMDRGKRGAITFVELNGNMQRLLQEAGPPVGKITRHCSDAKRSGINEVIRRTSTSLRASGKLLKPGPQPQVESGALPGTVEDLAMSAPLSRSLSGQVRGSDSAASKPQLFTDPAKGADGITTIRNQCSKEVAEELGKDFVWRFKYFTLFPPLSNMLLSLDHYFRILFPLAFLSFLLSSYSEVGFGSEHYKVLETVPCYNTLREDTVTSGPHQREDALKLTALP